MHLMTGKLNLNNVIRAVIDRPCILNGSLTESLSLRRGGTKGRSGGFLGTSPTLIIHYSLPLRGAGGIAA